jgi:hypothetical protein
MLVQCASNRGANNIHPSRTIATHLPVLLLLLHPLRHHPCRGWCIQLAFFLWLHTVSLHLPLLIHRRHLLYPLAAILGPQVTCSKLWELA